MKGEQEKQFRGSIESYVRSISAECAQRSYDTLGSMDGVELSFKFTEEPIGVGEIPERRTMAIHAEMSRVMTVKEIRDAELSGGDELDLPHDPKSESGQP